MSKAEEIVETLVELIEAIVADETGQNDDSYHGQFSYSARAKLKEQLEKALK